jgi:hypothetical protein
VTLTDAKDGHRLLDGMVTAKAEISGERIVKVDVDVRPASTAEGIYTSDVLLNGKEFEKASAPLTMAFTRSPREEWAVFFAICALAIGVTLGALLRWLTGTGAKLRLLLTRYELLDGLFGEEKWTPPTLKLALGEARVWVARGDVEQADEKLKVIEAKAEPTLKAMASLAELDRSISEGEKGIEGMQGLGPGKRAQLLDVTQGERKWLQEMRLNAYPEPEAEKETRAARRLDRRVRRVPGRIPGPGQAHRQMERCLGEIPSA